MPFLEPLRRQNHARAVEHQNLQPIAALRAKHENIAAIRIAQTLRDQGDEARHASPEIDWLRGHEHARLRGERNHRAVRNADITASSVAVNALGNPDRRAANFDFDRARSRRPRDGSGALFAMRRVAFHEHRGEQLAFRRGRGGERSRLSSPDVQQAATHAIASRDLRNIRLGSEAFANDPVLFLRRPIPSAAVSGDHLDPAISPVIMHGINHGISHPSTLLSF